MNDRRDFPTNQKIDFEEITPPSYLSSLTQDCAEEINSYLFNKHSNFKCVKELAEIIKGRQLKDIDTSLTRSVFLILFHSGEQHKKIRINKLTRSLILL